MLFKINIINKISKFIKKQLTIMQSKIYQFKLLLKTGYSDIIQFNFVIDKKEV